MNSQTIYYVRLKLCYQKSVTLTESNSLFTSAIFFTSLADAEEYRARLLPPLDVDPVYSAFCRIQYARGDVHSWLRQFKALLSKHDLPPLAALVPARTEAGRRHLLSGITPEGIIEHWWKRSLLSNHQRQLIWQFADPEPFVIIPVPMQAETDLVEAMASVNELLKPSGKTLDDYPAIPMPRCRPLNQHWAESEDNLLPPPSDGDMPPESPVYFEPENL